MSSGREKGTESTAIKVIDRACRFDWWLTGRERKGGKRDRLIDGDYCVGSRGDILNISMDSCRDGGTFFPYKDSTMEREKGIINIIEATCTR